MELIIGSNDWAWEVAHADQVGEAAVQDAKARRESFIALLLEWGLLNV